MNVLSWENSDRLFWLGRYSERAYSSIKFFADRFDSLIDLNNCDYMEQFADRFCFSEDEPDSIYSNLMRAYDNAIMLRDEIGSETLCYIQLAVYALNMARHSDAPILALQRVTDNIVAFWGMVDDSVDEQNVRSIIKLGKRIERIDNYAKQKMNADEIRREMKRLNIRIERTGLNYDAQKLFHLNLLVTCDELDYDMIVQEIESLVLNERQYFEHASGL